MAVDARLAAPDPVSPDFVFLLFVVWLRLTLIRIMDSFRFQRFIVSVAPPLEFATTTVLSVGTGRVFFFVRFLLFCFLRAALEMDFLAHWNYYTVEVYVLGKFTESAVLVERDVLCEN